MRNEVKYEWCYEEIQDGEVIDTDHEERLEAFGINRKTDTLVLVRNEGNDADGLLDRSWAYVKGGKLPENFSNESGASVEYKVPKAFHKELADYLSKTATKKSTMEQKFEIGNEVVRTDGGYTVGRKGKIVAIDSENKRAQVAWNGETKTWVAFTSLALTSVPYEITPVKFDEKGRRSSWAKYIRK